MYSYAILDADSIVVGCAYLDAEITSETAILVDDPSRYLGMKYVGGVFEKYTPTPTDPGPPPPPPDQKYANAYIMLCDTLAGTTDHVYTSFEDQLTQLKALKVSSEPDYNTTRDALAYIDRVMVARYGAAWRSLYSWSSNSTVISDAEAVLA
jgi:hypothetical protein